MRAKSVLRRLLSLRITTVWAFLYHHIPFTSSTSGHKHKHIKIDDEEKNLDESFVSSSPYPNSHNSRPRLIHSLRMFLFALFTLTLILLLLAYTIYKPPNLLIRFLQHQSPSVLYHVPLPSSNRTLALTIDDAPSPYTSRILDLLKEHGAKATFFIIGSQVRSSPLYPALLQRIHDEGHELGNHAWNDEPSISLPLTELSRQISDVEIILPKNVNEMKYFRPGSGVFNGKMVKLVQSLGYRLILGSIYPHDPQIHSPKVNAKHVLSMVRPGGIIIMHDRRDYSAEQLELVLKGLKEGGWKVESVGGLVAASELIRKRSVAQGDSVRPD